jgi:hypothetical protein
MLTYMNRLMLALVLLVSGCTLDRSKARNAVCQILISDVRPIEHFLRPRPGDLLDASACCIGSTMYVVFLNQSHSAGIAYDVGEFNSSTLEARNYGFGTLTQSREWSLFHTNGQSGVFFESHGGVETLREIALAMTRCSERKPLLRFNWPPSQPSPP